MRRDAERKGLKWELRGGLRKEEKRRGEERAFGRREEIGKRKEKSMGNRDAEIRKNRDQYRMPAHVAGSNRSARRLLHPRV